MILEFSLITFSHYSNTRIGDVQRCIDITAKIGRPRTTKVITGKSPVTYTAGSSSLTTQVCYLCRRSTCNHHGGTRPAFLAAI